MKTRKEEERGGNFFDLTLTLRQALYFQAHYLMRYKLDHYIMRHQITFGKHYTYKADMNILFLIAMVNSAGVVSAKGKKPYGNKGPDLPKGNAMEYEPNNLATPTTNDNLERQLSSKCRDNEEFITIDITTDWYGFENSWVLYRINNGTPTKLYAGPPSDTNYEGERRYLGGYCLSPGTYKFVMKDLWSDGMCCDSGEGKYAGYLQGREIFSSPTGDEDWERRGHEFLVPSSDSDLPFDSKSGVGTDMTPREENWLESHNIRRRTWYAFCAIR